MGVREGCASVVVDGAGGRDRRMMARLSLLVLGVRTEQQDGDHEDQACARECRTTHDVSPQGASCVSPTQRDDCVCTQRVVIDVNINRGSLRAKSV